MKIYLLFFVIALGPVVLTLGTYNRRTSKRCVQSLLLYTAGVYSACWMVYSSVPLDGISDV